MVVLISVVSNNTAKIPPQKCVVKYFGIFFQGKIILEGGFMKHKGCCVNSRKAYHFSGDYEFVTLA
jgi:hypothetical protein